MSITKLTGWLICDMLSIGLLTGCTGSIGSTGKNVSSSTTQAAEKKDTEPVGGNTHEALTITSSSGLDEFKELVHSKYPEINLEIIPYDGSNWPRFTRDQLIAGEMPDIYSTSLAWLTYPEEIKENLLDLSNYAFTDLYDPTLLSQQEVDGGLYLLPSNYYVYCIAYNKTLFDKHGWNVPNSFEELESLAPAIEEAGADLAATSTDTADTAFQYLCSLADTIDLSSIKGVKWQREFLNGTASAKEGFGEALDYMEEWISLGMLEGSDACGGKRAFDVFAEGNTAFMIGGVDRWTQNADGTGDQYAPMPYLSRNGTNNMYITTIAKNFGLNAALAEPGNEQKLKDALHVMEVLSTAEGQNAFSHLNSTCLSSLRAWDVEADNPFAPCMDLLAAGHSAPVIYAGWEVFLSQIGQKLLTYLDGNCTKEDVLNFADKALRSYRLDGIHTYSDVPRAYTPEETAVLVGKIFGEAADADLAMISLNVMRNDGRIQNSAGVNGYILPLPLTEERIVSFLPTGWNGTIQTVTLTGRQIHAFTEEGYVCEKDGETASFPYVLTIRGGGTLDDDTEYTAVVCGMSREMEAVGYASDSGIVGLQAFEHYFDSHGNPKMSEELLLWNR